MIIESIKHKALKRFAETGKPKGVMEHDRIVDMLAFIDSATAFNDLTTPPNFGFHPLKGKRVGTYAMTITKNFRLTFTKIDEQTIADLDIEDYH